MKPIVVVGSINMDLVSRAYRIPNPGETVIGESFASHSGGKGANQAVAVARLGYKSILLGALGSDAFGEELRQTLDAYGVDTQHLRTVPGSSGTASIVVDRNGENAIIVTPGANLEVTQEYLESKMSVLRGAGMVLAQLEIPLETVAWLASCCAELGVPLMLDPAPAAALPDSVLSSVTWLTPNETEADFYAGSSADPEQIARQLLARGVQNVILKRSSKGLLVAPRNGEVIGVSAVPVSAVDSTAAGDAFNGAFAVAMMRGNNIRESASYAAAAAAISVTRSGAQPSLATAEEVEALMARA